MEIPEEQPPQLASSNTTGGSNDTGGSNNDGCLQHAVVKGKRTRRQRATVPVAAPLVAAAASSASSSEFSGSATEEEEDMANCLILLAQGRALDARQKPESSPPAEEAAGGKHMTSRRFTEAATTTNVKAGFYVYECKTCNKCFPSFQALGGHRASHKRPKIAAAPAATTADDERKARVIDEDSLQISMNSFPASTAMATTTGNGKPRVHECSICGSEFSSGQALGGHMRRHRPITIPEASEASKKERTLLSLDLNLPAPSEDDRIDFPKSPRAMVLGFASKQPLTFSASSLVDCHY